MNSNNFAKQTHIVNVEFTDKNIIAPFMVPRNDQQTLPIILEDWFSSIRTYIMEQNLNDGTAIQAGGNFGVYPVLMREFFDTIYTFEPDPLNFYCLVNNCQYDNIIKLNSAVGDKPEILYMDIVSDINRGMNKVVENSKNHFITSITIDSLNPSNVKLIQLDVEGFESKTLEGARLTIEKYKPVIILECGDENNPNDSKNIKTNIEKMKELDYKVHKRINRLDITFLPNNS